MRKKIIDIFLPLVGCAAIILSWELVSLSGIWSPLLLPPPNRVFIKTAALVLSGAFIPDVVATLGRTIAGFAVASTLGVLGGLLLGTHAKAFRASKIVIDLFRSLPATAMFPLFLLVFGIGNGSKIAMAAFISLWVIMIGTVYGVLYSSKTRLRVARIFGASRGQVFMGVTLREAMPHIVVSLRTALSLSLIAVVVSEMFIGSYAGLGQKIYDAYTTYETVYLYAWLLITALLGYLLNLIFALVDKRLLHWVGK